MARLGPTVAPTLGVTAALALLWLLAAVEAGPDGPAAIALDPGQAGSIGAWWAVVQLAVALAVAVPIPELRVLGLAPAAMMSGEVGEVHLHAAHLLSAAAGSDQHLSEFKAATTLVLGAIAVGAAVHSRHRSCCQWLAVVIAVGGAASVLLELAPDRGTGRPWWSAAEEWSELAVYSVVAASILSLAIKSHEGTIMSREIGESSA